MRIREGALRRQTMRRAMNDDRWSIYEGDARPYTRWRIHSTIRSIIDEVGRDLGISEPISIESISSLSYCLGYSPNVMPMPATLYSTYTIYQRAYIIPVCAFDRIPSFRGLLRFTQINDQHVHTWTATLAAFGLLEKMRLISRLLSRAERWKSSFFLFFSFVFIKYNKRKYDYWVSSYFVNMLCYASNDIGSRYSDIHSFYRLLLFWYILFLPLSLLNIFHEWNSQINIALKNKSLLNQTKWRLRVANRICCRLNIIFNWMNTMSLFSSCEMIHSITYFVRLTTYAVGHPWPRILLIQQIMFFSMETIN